jgi:hypothetical protein
MTRLASLAALLALGACQQVNEIVLAIATDLKPDEIRWLHLEVDKLDPTPPKVIKECVEIKDVRLPSTVGILGAARERVRIVVGVGADAKCNELRFTHVARLRFPAGRIVELGIPLLRRCWQRCGVCNPGMTCGETDCIPEERDVDSLPDHDPKAELRGYDASAPFDLRCADGPRVEAGRDQLIDRGGDARKPDARADTRADAKRDAAPDIAKPLEGPRPEAKKIDARPDAPVDTKKIDAAKIDAPKPDIKKPDGPKPEGPKIDQSGGTPTWKKLTTTGIPSGKRLLGIWGSGTTMVVVGEHCFAAHASTTVPASWTPILPAGWSCDPQEHFYEVWGEGGTFYAGSSIRVAKITITTAAAVEDTKADVWSIWGTGLSHVLAVGDGGNVWRGPAPWSLDKGGIGVQDLRDVWAISGLEVVVGKNDALYTRATPTGNWAKVAWGTPGTTLRSVFGTGTADVIAVSDDGHVVRYDGIQWALTAKAPMTNFPYPLVHGLWAPDKDHYVAVGTMTSNACGGDNVGAGAGVVYHFASVGSTAQKVVPTGASHLCGVWGKAWDNVFAVGHDGTVLHYGY